jgi:hypothetical protein
MSGSPDRKDPFSRTTPAVEDLPPVPSPCSLLSILLCTNLIILQECLPVIHCQLFDDLQEEAGT